MAAANRSQDYQFKAGAPQKTGVGSLLEREALMQAAAPIRFLSAVAWPLTIWTTLSHFDDHAADDYVERTSPIVASAVGFWICLIALVIFANPAVVAVGGGSIGEADMFEYVRRVPTGVIDVLMFFTPVLYLIGLWLFAARDEAFPH
jgi:hypothetical protein